MIAFPGDSLTFLWLLSLFFGNPINYGVPGETCSQVATRLPAIIAQKPAAIHLLCGTNDVPGSQVAAVASVMPHAIKARNEGIRFIFAQIPDRDWPQAEAFNAELVTRAKENGFTEIADYRTILALPGGGQNPLMFNQSDKTHLTRFAYDAMVGELDRVTGYTLPILTHNSWGAYREQMIFGRSASNSEVMFDLIMDTLPPGEYDIDATASWATAGTMQYIGLGVSTSPGPDSTGLIVGKNYERHEIPNMTQGGPPVRYRLTVTQPTTIYLKAFLRYSGGVPAANAKLGWTRRNVQQ